MDINEFQLSMIAYTAGYAFAVLGAFPIGLVVRRITKQIHLEEVPENTSLEKFISFQRAFLGIIERILYVSSLLAGYGYFIGFWITLKMGGYLITYEFWKKQLPGRVSYMNTILGNGLSLLYAVVSYSLILCIPKKYWLQAIIEPAVLVLLTVFFWLILPQTSLRNSNIEQTITAKQIMRVIMPKKIYLFIIAVTTIFLTGLILD